MKELIGSYLKDTVEFSSMLEERTVGEVAYKAYRELGIDLPYNFKEQVQKIPEVFYLAKYKGKPEFQEEFFRIR